MSNPAFDLSRFTGRLENAAARYEELLELTPIGSETQEDWFHAHVALGGIYERLGRVDAARGVYERLIDRWKAADDNLVLLKAARSRLQVLVGK